MAISRRAFLRTLVAGSVTAGGAAAYGYLVERTALAVTEATAQVVGLPSALAGLRIGWLTDVHRSRWVSDDYVRMAVQLLMRAQPDIIALGGDYVTWGDRRFVEPAAHALGGLDAPHGVFAVLGNHDDDRDMPAALAAQGIEVLKDARTRLTIRNEGLDMAGIRFWTEQERAIEKVVRGASAPVVLLAHNPLRLTEAAALGVPLVLSGHTHGGQVVLPVVGPVAARRYPITAGLGQQGRTTIFVSRGVGTVYIPVRINCPPEVAVVTLQPAPAG